MRRLITLILIATTFHLSAQQTNCDSIYENILPTGKQNAIAISKIEEDKLNDILRSCPDHKQTHKAIQEIREFYCISIPIMSLMWRNIVDPYSKEAKKNIKDIKKLSERYLSFSPQGTTMAIPRNFVEEWDADYENNISSLEAGFTLIGVMNHAPKLKNTNSADRLIEAFEKIFSKADSTRISHYGFYYDFYYDYFWEIYKSEYFETAMYLVMLRTKDQEIENWINQNSEKINSFYNWRNKYLNEIKQ
jgi:hypothetical protein